MWKKVSGLKLICRKGSTSVIDNVINVLILIFHCLYWKILRFTQSCQLFASKPKGKNLWVLEGARLLETAFPGWQ